MYDSCRSQVSQCMTPAGVKYVMMYEFYLPSYEINLIQNPWVEWLIIICNVHNHIITQVKRSVNYYQVSNWSAPTVDGKWFSRLTVYNLDSGRNIGVTNSSPAVELQCRGMEISASVLKLVKGTIAPTCMEKG